MFKKFLIKQEKKKVEMVKTNKIQHKNGKNINEIDLNYQYQDGFLLPIDKNNIFALLFLKFNIISNIKFYCFIK